MSNPQSAKSTDKIKENTPTWNQLINLDWELTESGEIITADPANIPYIKKLIKCRYNSDYLPDLMAELGVDFIDEPLDSGNRIDLKWSISADGEIITDQPEHIPFIKTYLKNLEIAEEFQD